MMSPPNNIICIYRDTLWQIWKKRRLGLADSRCWKLMEARWRCLTGQTDQWESFHGIFLKKMTCQCIYIYIYIYHTSLLFEGFWLGFPKRVYKHYIHLNCLETNEWFFCKLLKSSFNKKNCPCCCDFVSYQMILLVTFLPKQLPTPIHGAFFSWSSFGLFGIRYRNKWTAKSHLKKWWLGDDPFLFLRVNKTYFHGSSAVGCWKDSSNVILSMVQKSPRPTAWDV